LVREVAPLFNRAVLFDTSQNSWHGLPEPLRCPLGVTRNSLAVYYLLGVSESHDKRGKALFAPYKDQIFDPEVLDLIKKRADIDQAPLVYERKNQG
jgi:hypothetical protein